MKYRNVGSILDNVCNIISMSAHHKVVHVCNFICTNFLNSPRSGCLVKTTLRFGQLFHLMQDWAMKCQLKIIAAAKKVEKTSCDLLMSPFQVLFLDAKTTVLQFGHTFFFNIVNLLKVHTHKIYHRLIGQSMVGYNRVCVEAGHVCRLFITHIVGTVYKFNSFTVQEMTN